MQHNKNQPGLFSFLIFGLKLIGRLPSIFAQQLSGKFTDFKSRNLILEGFDGFTTPKSKTIVWLKHLLLKSNFDEYSCSSLTITINCGLK